MGFRLVFAALSLFFTSAVQAQTNCPALDTTNIVQDPVFRAGVTEAWRRSTEEESIREHGFNMYHCWRSIDENGQARLEYTSEIDWTIEGGRHYTQFPPPRTQRECRLVTQLHTHPEDPRFVDYDDEFIEQLPGLTNLMPRFVEDELSDSDLKVANRFKVPHFIVYKEGPNSANGELILGSYTDIEPEPNWLCGQCEGQGGADDLTPESTCPVDTTSPFTVEPPIPVSYTNNHIVTIDGLTYEFQAVGEFVLVKSELTGFEIQSRQAQYGGSESQVSVNVGFAFDVNGDDVSTVFTPDGLLTLYVNGEPQTAPEEIDLPEGGRIVVESRFYRISWPDGSLAEITDRSSFLDLSLGLNSRHTGLMSGLLGNFDGIAENDLLTSDEIDITSRPEANVLYGAYADGWRVTEETSLYSYLEGESTASFTNRLLPGRVISVGDLDETVGQDARVVCTTAGVVDEVILDDCILDVGISGDVEFATTLSEVQEALTLVVETVVVQGKIDRPSFACKPTSTGDPEQISVPELAELYGGTFTNPDGELLWDTQLTLNQCDAEFSGLLIISTENANFQNRRLLGKWEQDRLVLDAGYPFRFEDVTNINSPCRDMVLTLSGDDSGLSGFWTASNCPQGGEINVDAE